MTHSLLLRSADQGADPNAGASIYDDRDATPDELRAILARSATGNGWEDPGMDAYDHYDKERRP